MTIALLELLSFYPAPQNQCLALAANNAALSCTATSENSGLFDTFSVLVWFDYSKNKTSAMTWMTRSLGIPLWRGTSLLNQEEEDEENVVTICSYTGEELIRLQFGHKQEVGLNR